MKKSAIQHYLASLMNDLTFVLVTGENLAAGADAQNNAALVCLCATPALVGSHQERVSLETERKQRPAAKPKCRRYASQSHQVQLSGR